MAPVREYMPTAREAGHRCLAESENAQLLLTMLQSAVPFYQAELVDLPAGVLIERAKRCWWRFSGGESGADLCPDAMMGTDETACTPDGAVGANFAALAEAIAAMSFLPRGFVFLGQHWQAPSREVCPSEEEAGVEGETLESFSRHCLSLRGLS